MKRTDYTNLGGLKFTQNRVAFLQDGYNEAMGALATLCGDKVILYGVQKVGSNVTSGWIAYKDPITSKTELIRFIGGAYAANVIISEAAVTNLVFEDGSAHDVHFDKTATCGSVGGFPFSDLQPLISLQNIWMPGDLKQKCVDAAYQAANFDGDGYGLNAETGWRIFSKADANAAGKVLVNLDPLDATFDTVGKHGGEKAHTLTVPEIPAHVHSYSKPTADGSATGNANSHPDGPMVTTNTGSTGGGGSHNNLQPYYVVLTLIKL